MAETSLIDAPRGAPLDGIFAALRSGEELTDEVFDAIYSPRTRALSSHHWTPIAVADLAIPWLTQSARRVLDVGAGVGKLCVYGALTTRDVVFVGIEQRADLVEEARATAARLGVADRVEIHHTTIDAFDPAGFDSMYLFNPFGENILDAPIDRLVELGRERYARDIETMERWLREAPVGARVVTFHGFGGWLPDSFRLTASYRVDWDALRVWDKHRAGGVLRTAYAEKRPWR